MAIVLKCRYFKSAVEVTEFVNANIAAASDIIELTFDPITSQYVLFYV